MGLLVIILTVILPVIRHCCYKAKDQEANDKYNEN